MLRLGWHPGSCWVGSGAAHTNRALVLLLLLPLLPRSSCAAQVKHPCILQHFDAFLEMVSGKRVAVFLDYDGELPQQSIPTAAARSGTGRGNADLPLLSSLCVQAHSHPLSTTQIKPSCPLRYCS
jgi:hypothetical protein